MGLLLYHFPEVLDGSDSGLNLDASYNAGLNKMLAFRSVCFAICESHLNYSSLVWVQSPVTIKHLAILQKKPLK